ncbi:S8 family serine peptidase [Corynebacterium sp. CCM 9204]|uniref:S8 family serine peptidase n=1 Tax=Corynebacterium sp. CCM 9204 TaxID=3057616 RepID=UPI003523BAB4
MRWHHITCTGAIIVLMMVIPTPTFAAPPEFDPDCAVPVPATPSLIMELGPPPDSLTRAHRFATGAGVRVAVIDTGISPHPRLPPPVAGGDLVVPRERRPEAPPLPDGALDDCDGHGTIVAGVLSAQPSPEDGVLGVAPGIELLSIRQTSRSRAAESPGSGGNLLTLTSALNLAIDQGARIINVSLTSCLHPALADKVDTRDFDSVLNRAEELGVVVVAAAGNVSAQCPPGSTVLPAHRPTVVSVAALDTPHNISGYSVEGPGPLLSASGRIPVAVSPQGTGLAAGLTDGTGVRAFEGTSFAAPVVSGTAALLMELHPTDSAAGIRARLASAVDPATGAVNPDKVVTHLAADYRGTPHPVTITAPDPPSTALHRRTITTFISLLCFIGPAFIIMHSRRQRRSRNGQ